MKTFFECIRILLRFPDTFWVVSTFMRTFPSEFTPMSPLDCYKQQQTISPTEFWE